MPDNVTFLYNDLFKDATLTANSEVATLPAENAQDPLVDNVYRSTGDTAEWLKFNLGSAKSLNNVALINHNLTTSASNIIVEGNGSDSWATPTFSQTFSAWETGETDSGLKTIVRNIFLSSTPSLQWWRIRLEDPTNPDGYIEIGRVMGGEYFEAEQNYNSGYKQEIVDLSHKTQVGSYRTIDRRGKYNEIRCNISYISSADKFDEWLTMFQAVGITDDVVMCLDPSDAEGRNLLSFYGQFEDGIPMTHQQTEYSGTSIMFRESIGDQT
jgi:hypothetical protein